MRDTTTSAVRHLAPFSFSRLLRLSSFRGGLYNRCLYFICQSKSFPTICVYTRFVYTKERDIYTPPYSKSKPTRSLLHRRCSCWNSPHIVRFIYILSLVSSCRPFTSFFSCPCQHIYLCLTLCSYDIPGLLVLFCFCFLHRHSSSIFRSFVCEY